MAMEQERLLYQPNIQRNHGKLQHLHSIMTLALGTGAGILTLESFQGFVTYFVGLTITNVVFYIVCCKGQADSFFESPIKEIFISSMPEYLPGFIMMWCLVYALVN